MKKKLAVFLSSLSLLAGVQNKAESFSFLENLSEISIIGLLGCTTVYEAYNVPRNLIKTGYKNYNKVDLILDILIGISGGWATVAAYQFFDIFDSEMAHKRKKENTNDEQSSKLNETLHSSEEPHVS